MILNNFSWYTRFTKFIDWWLTGLSYLVPARWYALFFVRPVQLTLEVDKDMIIINRYDEKGSDKILDTRSFKIGDNIQHAEILSWLGEQYKNQVRTTLLVTDNIVLRKKLSMPEAIKKNMHEAIGFELGRKTPFSPEQIYYNYSVTEVDKKNKRLHLDVFILPRKHVDGLLKIIAPLKVEIDSISPKEKMDVSLIVLSNFASKNSFDKLSLVLSIVVFLLFLSLLYVPLAKQKKQIEWLEAENNSMKKVMTQLEELNEQQDNMYKRIFFVAEKRGKRLTRVKLLNEITKIIPDHTWLNSLKIRSDQIELRGRSDNAYSIIKIIESSDLFEGAKFKAPIVKDNRSQKDKFSLFARIVNASPTP